jgi:hypothetical protein
MAADVSGAAGDEDGLHEGLRWLDAGLLIRVR